MNRKVLAAIFSAAVLVVIVMTVILYHLSGFSSLCEHGLHGGRGMSRKTGQDILPSDWRAARPGTAQ